MQRFPLTGLRPRRAYRIATLAMALLVLASEASSGQNLAGDYVLAVDGQAIMSLMLRQDAAGRLTGTVSAAGKALPLSGEVRGSGGVFVSSAPDGSRLHWEVAPQGAGLAVVMAPAGVDGRPDPALAQRHVMVRGQPGSGGVVGGSQKWIARLSAAADSIVSWCASPMYAESDLCMNAMQVLRKVAPALMVARFATSGQAGSLLRVLAQGPGAAPGDVAPIVSADDSFLSAIDPAPVDDEPPAPDEFVEPPQEVAAPPAAAPSPPAAALPTLAQSLLGGAAPGAPAPPASGFAGDWVLLHAGSEMLRLRVEESGGRLSGTLSLMGTAFPISGTASGGRLAFTTRSPSGEAGRWQGVMSGERLDLVLTTSSGTERYELRRQGAGWSDAAPLARQWDAMLRGRIIAHSAGARDPATGGPAETLLHFCADGRLRLEVGGAPGAVEPAWRVVASGDQAALELSSADGTIQVGLARVAEGITFAGQPARLLGAATACR